MPLFPLLVEEVTTHVVFYDADDHAQALRMAREDGGDLVACLGPDTRADVDLTVTMPGDEWQQRLVKEPSTFGYPGEAAAAA